MRTLLLLLLVCTVLFSCRKKAGNTTEQKLRTENLELRQENDSLKRLLAQNAIRLEADTLAKEPVDDAPSQGGDIAGKHALTLQWIGWDHPGSVTATPAANGWYRITGEQNDPKNKDNYLRIDGRIRHIGERELEFHGTIETKVDMINSGKPCVRTGRKIFKATGTRKYWRLQDMINCEGGLVTDYVDIYF